MSNKDSEVMKEGVHSLPIQLNFEGCRVNLFIMSFISGVCGMLKQ